MGTRLYIGNLPFSVTNAELKSTFEQIGEVVTAKVVMDRDSGKSRGFAFVEMATEEAAQEAIEKLNGFKFDGRNILVSEAQPLAPRSDRGGFNKG